MVHDTHLFSLVNESDTVKPKLRKDSLGGQHVSVRTSAVFLGSKAETSIVEDDGLAAVSVHHRIAVRLWKETKMCHDYTTIPI